MRRNAGWRSFTPGQVAGNRPRTRLFARCAEDLVRMRIVFHPEAYEEMLESARFFEEKSPGPRFRSHSLLFKRRPAGSLNFPSQVRLRSMVFVNAWSHGFPSHYFTRARQDHIFHRRRHAPAPQARLLARAFEVASLPPAVETQYTNIGRLARALPGGKWASFPTEVIGRCCRI